MVSDDPSNWSLGDMKDRIGALDEGKGYREDARGLLKLFCAQAQKPPLSRAPTFEEPLLSYVVSALSVYLNGEAPTLDHAFGLKQRGRPRRRSTTERNERIASAVATRMQVHNETLEVAAEEVSKQFGVHESDVRNFYAEHKSLAQVTAEFAKSYRSGDR
jgi:hypothetical protein